MLGRPLAGIAAAADGRDPRRHGLLRAPAEAAGGKPPAKPAHAPADRDLDVDVLARTLYGEARGEAVRGKEAVAAVILNRVQIAQRAGGHWWGTTVADVCRKPWQFSCWNPDDPNRDKILAVDKRDSVFATCLRIARRACAGELADPTEGATHYHHKDLEPDWATGHAPCAAIGAHLFYNDMEVG